MDLKSKRIYFSNHSVKQMFQRNISIAEVKDVIENGVIIKSYVDDKPYPSYLAFAFIKKRPLHVVYSINDKEIIIITAYQPDSIIWEDDFKTRKKT